MPAPLTPSDCDLTDFPRMMIDIPRLQQSKFDATTDDTAWRAGLNLWFAAWHSVPAGSLENDEESLVKAAGLGRDLKTWRKISEVALRGFIECDDGRLYHETVSEFALEAWLEKLAQALSSGAGNAKRWKVAFDPAPIEAEIKATAGMLRALNPKSKALVKLERRKSRVLSGDDPGGTGSASQLDHENVPAGSQEKGTGKGTGKGTLREGADAPSAERAPKRSAKQAPDAALVERLWAFQPVCGGKRKATRPEVVDALAAALKRGGDPAEIEAAFKAYYALPDCQRDGGQYARGAAVLLNGDKWRDFAPGAEGSPQEVEPPWPGPPEIRGAVLDSLEKPEYTDSYLKHCTWRDVPEKALVTANNYVADVLRKQCGARLAKDGVRVLLKDAAA